MANFSMASKMATKKRNPTTERENILLLLSDVLNVFHLKPKMLPQSVWVYNGLKQVFPTVYSIYIVYKYKRWAIKHAIVVLFYLFQATIQTEPASFFHRVYFKVIYTVIYVKKEVIIHMCESAIDRCKNISV